ncbi:MAG: cyclic nucleotide-binding domain-containing protein [Flavobacteriales bacterium]|nr:cyclic nucleotide-binding domain-containing protein [Flavobacteriales bacterium]
MIVEADVFESVPVLRDLPAEHQDFLNRFVQFKSFPKNAFIYNPGEMADWVYFVVDGMVKTGTINDEGKEVIKNIFYPGEMFGELGLSGMIERPDFAATLKSGVEVLRIPVHALKELINKSPEVGLRMIEKLGERITRSEKRLEQLVFDDARTRIIAFLKEQATKNGIKFADETLIKHGFTHQDMANITGTSRQLVTIVLNELKKENLINFDRSSILIRDVDQLK